MKGEKIELVLCLSMILLFPVRKCDVMYESTSDIAFYRSSNVVSGHVCLMSKYEPLMISFTLNS